MSYFQNTECGANQYRWVEVQSGANNLQEGNHRGSKSTVEKILWRIRYDFLYLSIFYPSIFAIYLSGFAYIYLTDNLKKGNHRGSKSTVETSISSILSHYRQEARKKIAGDPAYNLRYIIRQIDIIYQRMHPLEASRGT